jgi:hypothetical protein
VGDVPEITVTPASHDFGSVLVGTTVSHSIEIRNDGTANLHVSSIALPEGGDFVIASGSGAVTLAPGQTHTVEVIFAPTALGPRTDSLRIESDDDDEATLDVALAGTGVSAPTPDISVFPPSFDFGDVFEGSTQSAEIQVHNTGSATLHVTSFSLEGNDAAQFSIASATSFFVAPGESVATVLTFTPASVGAKTASLRVESDDPDGSPLHVPITGTGVTLPPGGVDVVFEEVRTGTSSSSDVVTSAAIGGGSATLYIAAVSSKKFKSVTGVTGAGLSWALVREQCSGRNQTGTSVWQAFGASTGGPVTATFEAAPSNAVIAVSRYSGASAASPIGEIVSGNSNGVDGACDGGTDGASYAFGVTTAATGSLVYGAASMRGHAHEPGPGFTERAEALAGSGGGAASVAVQDRSPPAPATLSVSGTFDSSTDWAAVALVILPGSVPAGAHQSPGEAAAPGGSQIASARHPVGGLPDRFALMPSYPNPFRSSTTIDYALPEPTRVELVIHDTHGRVVRTLLRGHEDAGFRRTSWDGRDGNGRRVASGVYFLRLTAGDRSMMKKMVMMK